MFRAGPLSEASGDPVVHKIPLANQFQVPVVIYDVKLPAKAQDYFTVSKGRGRGRGGVEHFMEPGRSETLMKGAELDIDGRGGIEH